MRSEPQFFTSAIALLQRTARTAHRLEVAALRRAVDRLCALRTGPARCPDVAFGSRNDSQFVPTADSPIRGD